MKIPKEMDNEESKFIAAVIIAERNLKIAKADLFSSKNKLKKYRHGS